jgi:hypothetical protein
MGVCLEQEKSLSLVAIMTTLPTMVLNILTKANTKILMAEMKNKFKKAWRIYLILLTILSLVFWGYMIYDDWVLVEEYGITFTIYYWIIVSAGILIYGKLKKQEN